MRRATIAIPIRWLVFDDAVASGNPKYVASRLRYCFGREPQIQPLDPHLQVGPWVGVLVIPSYQTISLRATSSKEFPEDRI